MARSLLKERQVPSQMWGEAVRHAIYILNKMPTRALSNVTPYEAWTGSKPNLHHLRVFGCIAHMKVPSVQLRKLDDRSKHCVHFGREAGTKAYRLYDTHKGCIHINRDVVFEEDKGWSWGNNNVETSSFESFTVVNFPVEVNMENDIRDTEMSTPQSQRSIARSTNESEGDRTQDSATSYSANSSSSSNSETRYFRALDDVYDDTERIELANDELFLIGVEEPITYDQASKEKVWTDAMQSEIQAIKKNHTWELTDLPKG